MIKPRRRIETKPRRRIEVPKMAASKAWGDDGDAVCGGADVGAAGADGRGVGDGHVVESAAVR
jgi:hypothetical protein